MQLNLIQFESLSAKEKGQALNTFRLMKESLEYSLSHLNQVHGCGTGASVSVAGSIISGIEMIEIMDRALNDAVALELHEIELKERRESRGK